MSLRMIDAAFDTPTPTPGSKLVLVALADHADDRGESCFPSQIRLAKMCSMTAEGVRKALMKLSEIGLVQWQTSRRGNRYRLLLTPTQLGSEPNRVGIRTQQGLVQNPTEFGLEPNPVGIRTQQGLVQNPTEFGLEPNPVGSIRQEPSTNHQQPSTAVVVVGGVSSPVPPINHQPPRAVSDSQKKEGGSGRWLNLEEPEAWAVINAALGRPAARAFTGDEARALREYARPEGGQISVAEFEALRGWLHAEPRYDNNAQQQHDAVPEDDLRRKRRRTGLRVLLDLPNQIEHALKWVAASEKKRAVGALDEPEWDWRSFSAKRCGITTTLPWKLLTERMKIIIIETHQNTPE